MTISNLHYITDSTQGLEPLLKAGLNWVQLRVKNRNEKEMYNLADSFVALCEKYKAYSIINDYPKLAKKVGADGVHLGKEDMSVAEARALLGKDFIIGGTANTYEDVEALSEAGADYVGLGPFRFTETKKNLSPVLGLEGYNEILQSCSVNGIRVPIIAIGGITVEDLEALRDAGLHGVAVSGAIRKAQNQVAAVKQFLGK
ncbi:thiamine phosphate synthase [Cytophaga aurantiaca]|uniref:thiamine phosphate synthase n=1 Tax=Cytophaga aurantiaca TaxID=29530 RepID=UPI00038161C2|nr:thiamine phosphate synthase [Cytophaga aurantiaca]